MTQKKLRPKADIETLAALISTHAPYDGSFELRVPGIYAIRVSQPHKELTHYTQQSCVCIVAQGAKTATVGEESFEYKVGQSCRLLDRCAARGARHARIGRSTVPELQDRSRRGEDP